MAIITKYGFERESYEELLERVKDRFRQDMGVDAQLDDDNALGQLAAILAKLLNDDYRMAEAVWASQKLDGAEGPFLDDIFSKNGVYRRGKQPSTGTVIIHTDATAANNQVVSSSTQFTATNGKVYQPDEEILLTTAVVAYKLTLEDIVNTSYTANLVSTVTGETVNLTFVNDGTDADKRNMMQAMASVWLTHTDRNEDRIFIEDDVLYVGYYVSSGELVGIQEQTEWQIIPVVGEKWQALSVTATQEGYAPLLANGIQEMTPEFTGFVEALNLTSFYSGSEVETDAEYRTRYFNEIKALSGTTRDGVASNVLKVDGVTKVTIYDNPTPNNRDDADAFSFQVVTLGGTTSAITQAIYKSKPINTRTTGAISATVNTLDGSTETIRYSSATQVEVDVRIDYRTNDRIPLSNLERSQISTGIKQFFSELNIGEVLYNTQLIFTVLNSATRNRIVSVDIYTKLSSQANGLFSRENLVPDYTELLVLRDGGVSFNQLIS